MKKHLKKLTLATVLLMTFIPLTKAQNLSKQFGEDSINCRINLSLYRESFKQNNFVEAYPQWKWVKDSCPMASKYIFTNGPVILDYLIKEEEGKDSVKREEYIQELFDLFDLRIKCHPADEGYVLGRIGVYMMKYREPEYKKAREYMEKSIELENTESSPQVLDLYFKATEIYKQREKLDIEIMIDAYDKVTEVLDAMLDKAELDVEKIMRQIYNLQENLDSGRISKEDYEVTYADRAKDSVKFGNELKQLRTVSNNMNIRFLNHANCDVLVQVYTKKFETNRQDKRTLMQIIKIFPKVEKCTENNLFISAVEELYKQSPTANLAYFMGNTKYNKKEYRDAITYLEQAVEMFEKESEKIKMYMLMAECYRQLNQYSAARETAYKVLQLNPHSGSVYVFVGIMYMSTASSCGTEVPGAAYWAAADKFARAKAVDPSIADEAQKQLNAASARFPETASYFQLGLSKGQPYKIDCWIGETTIIR